MVATDFHYTCLHVCSRIFWDIRCHSASGPFGIEDPFAVRSICFYPNVFGRNTKGVPVLDAVMKSEEAVTEAAADEAERRRLACVGMTRARDTIIAAVPASNPRNDAWIRSFASRHLLAAGAVLELPEGEPIPSLARSLADAEAAESASDRSTPSWFHEREPIESPPRER